MRHEANEKMKHNVGREQGQFIEHEGRKEGAKTFRRKRAIMFLEHLETKRNVLKKQLETVELQTINPVILGELKATEAIIAEFVQMFELFEYKEYENLKENDEEDIKE